MPPFSMGDEAEPRVGMGTPKLPFGTSLCQFFCSLAQLCATCFESVRVRFDFQHFIFSVRFFSKKESFFYRFLFFSGGPAAKKRCLHVEANGFFKGLHVEASSPFS